MTYNHSKNAGNLGDVFKHMVLLEVLQHLIEEKSLSRSKDFTFGYMETHCGAPEHHLTPNGSWEDGVGVLRNKYIGNGETPEDVSDFKYLEYVLDSVHEDQIYPSSWSLAKRLMRESDVGTYSLTLFDTSAEVAQAMKSEVEYDSRITYFCKDGYTNFKNNLRRIDFVLIDPPYKAGKSEKFSKDWVDAVKTAKYLQNKGVPFMLWYPYFTDKNPTKMLNEVKLPSLLMLNPSLAGQADVMKGSGLVVGGIAPEVVEAIGKNVAKPLDSLGVVQFLA